MIQALATFIPDRPNRIDSKDAIYLDHAGTTLPSKSLIEEFSSSMLSQLLGNPHAMSRASQNATSLIDDVRHDVLQFFNASPRMYDVVFTANATAAMKLVADSLSSQRFWFGYHKDSHTSLVGIRGLANEGFRSFDTESDMRNYVGAKPLRNEKFPKNEDDPRYELFAYPAQSNMTGTRISTTLCKHIRDRRKLLDLESYSLLDAAALVSTSPLDLSDPDTAPDFVTVSFYKIFGFPDLGALLVHRDAGTLLRTRSYFGGGTVDLVTTGTENWHSLKSGSPHNFLEDGTLPTHSILALKAAITGHVKLYKSIRHVSMHTSRLADELYRGLQLLEHGNGTKLCVMHHSQETDFLDSARQGPVICFNMKESNGSWFSNHEVEKLALIHDIHLRSGGLCNPGGIASALQLNPWEIRENFSAGVRCGSENDVVNGKPTGAIRVSFGAMSILKDVHGFLEFLKSNFINDCVQCSSFSLHQDVATGPPEYAVESVTIYPIKSCAGYNVPPATRWPVGVEGLAWDREWCLVHASSGEVLSQKKHTRMAFITPVIDFDAGLLRINVHTRASDVPNNTPTAISVPLSNDPEWYLDNSNEADWEINVCGDNVATRIYKSSHIKDFFTDVIGVPCNLARFPTSSRSHGDNQPLRFAKPHLQPLVEGVPAQQSLRLSNESPILITTQPSLDSLNQSIKMANPDAQAVMQSVFRPNIVLCELQPANSHRLAYAEDWWSSIIFDDPPSAFTIRVLGNCRRCQMVCVDQLTGKKHKEPLVSLAKTRRRDGKVWFGVHSSLDPGFRGPDYATVAVGDHATPQCDPSSPNCAMG